MVGPALQPPRDRELKANFSVGNAQPLSVLFLRNNELLQAEPLQRLRVDIVLDDQRPELCLYMKTLCVLICIAFI